MQHIGSAHAVGILTPEVTPRVYERLPLAFDLAVGADVHDGHFDDPVVAACGAFSCAGIVTDHDAATVK